MVELLNLNYNSQVNEAPPTRSLQDKAEINFKFYFNRSKSDRCLAVFKQTNLI